VPGHSSDGYAGLAWVMGGDSVGPQFESLGFSAVDGDQLVWAFAHEIGHNMGSNHDHYSAGTDTYAAYPYSFGYINPDAGFYTIMSYTSACSDAGKNCRRVQWYSNPNLTQNGAPTGIPEGQANAADNRKTFTQTTPIVANFRSARASITAANASVVEGSGGTSSLVYTVFRSQPLARSLTLSYSFEDITATNGSDYTGVAGTVTFGPLQAQATITVPITPDTRYEGNELFAINFTGDPSQVLAPARAVITILDDDPATLSITGGQILEGNGGTLPELQFKLTLDNAQGSASQIDYATRDVTTQSGIDYYPTSGTARFAAGQTEVVVTVPIRGDNIAEPDETFELVLSNPSNMRVASDRATGTIINDDLPGITLSDTTAREAPGGSVATFTATLSTPWPSPVSAAFSTMEGTAGASDFTPVAGRVTFAPGQVTQTITVPILDDLVVEPEEQFTLQLSDAQGAVIDDGEAICRVQDDDSSGLSISDAQELEGNGLGDATRYLRFDITLDSPATAGSSVAFSTVDGTATAGTDYDGASGTISFVAGQLTAQVQVSIRGDLQVEDNETLQLVLSSPNGVRLGRSSAVGTIVNDDVPSLSISDGSAREADGGSAASFTVSLSSPWPTPISVAFSTAEGTATSADFTPSSGVLVFAPGQTSQVISVPIVNDALFEDDETFTVHLSDPNGARIEDGEGVGTIVSDDAQPALSIDGAKNLEGNEGTSYLEFPLHLAAPSSQRVSVSYLTQAGSATAGTDYVAVVGEAVIEAGQTQGVVRVPIRGDGAIESDESFFVVLSHAVNARIQVARAVGTIQNDDRDTVPPTVSILKPVARSVSAAWPVMNGLASDAERVTRVTVRLQRLSDGRFWNGSAWAGAADTRIAFNATLRTEGKNVRWSVAIAPPTAQSQSGSYRLIANAFDAAGNRGEASVTFTLDRSGPLLTITNPRDKSVLRALSLASGTAVDVPTGVLKVELWIVRKSDNRYWNGHEWTALKTALRAALSGSAWRVSTLPRDWRGGYTFTPRATDALGNTSDKSATVTFASSRAA